MVSCAAEDLPLDELARLLKVCESTFKEAEAEPRCERCEWGITEEVRQKGFSVRDPDPTRAILRSVKPLPCGAATSWPRGVCKMRCVRSEPASPCRGIRPTRLAATLRHFGMFISSLCWRRWTNSFEPPTRRACTGRSPTCRGRLFDYANMMQGERVGVYGGFLARPR